MSLDLFPLFSCINQETVLTTAASIQGWLLFFIFKHFVRFLFEGGSYLRAASIQENTVEHETTGYVRGLFKKFVD